MEPGRAEGEVVLSTVVPYMKGLELGTGQTLSPKNAPPFQETVGTLGSDLPAGLNAHTCMSVLVDIILSGQSLVMLDHLDHDLLIDESGDLTGCGSGRPLNSPVGEGWGNGSGQVYEESYDVALSRGNGTSWPLTGFLPDKWVRYHQKGV